MVLNQRLLWWLLISLRGGPLVCRWWSSDAAAVGREARLYTVEQQIQRYKATGYASASLARLGEVATALSVAVTETVTLIDTTAAQRIKSFHCCATHIAAVQVNRHGGC